MSTVMTITATGAPPEQAPARLHLTLRLTAPQRTSIESVHYFCKALLEIKSRHSDEADPLSEQIHDCIEEIFALQKEGKDLHPEDAASLGILIDRAKSLIKKLRDSVLVDSLFGMPLINPIRQGEWVWDEKILRACQNTYQALGIIPESPLTETPFEDLQAHTFATEMLRFIRTLPAEFLLPTLHEELSIASPEELHVPEDPSEMEPIKTPKETLGDIPLPPEVRSSLLERLQKSYQEQLTERRSHIEGNYALFRANGDIARAGRRLDRTVMEIETLREVFQRVEVESKRIAVQELEARRIRSEAHTQFVITSIQAMKQAHKAERDLLAATIADVRRDLTRTQADLAQAQEQIKQNTQQIAQLSARAHQLECQVRGMQDQVNDDGGGCSIM